MDERKHVNIIANIYIILAVVYLLIAAIILLATTGIANIIDERTIEDLIGVTGGIAGTILLILGSVILAGALGLKKYQEWARTLMIVISVITLLNFPIGTIIGVYGLVVLVKSDTKRLFNDTHNEPVT